MGDEAAVARIVVQATNKEKKDIATKAKKMGIPIAELMRRGAFAYEDNEQHEELARLADQAKAAADRACDRIDASLSYIEASNLRIAAMERKAKAGRTRNGAL
ncbi:MAG: hypothetical protein RL020_1085 [Pseudomonadota bacterium]|jgi:hypothetical protein